MIQKFKLSNLVPLILLAICGYCLFNLLSSNSSSSNKSSQNLIQPEIQAISDNLGDASDSQNTLRDNNHPNPNLKNSPVLAPSQHDPEFEAESSQISKQFQNFWNKFASPSKHANFNSNLIRNSRSNSKNMTQFLMQSHADRNKISGMEKLIFQDDSKISSLKIDASQVWSENFDVVFDSDNVGEDFFAYNKTCRSHSCLKMCNNTDSIGWGFRKFLRPRR